MPEIPVRLWRDVRQVNVWTAPKLLILGRSKSPPLCGFRQNSSDESPDEDEEKPAQEQVERVSGIKRELRGFSRKSSQSISRLLSTIDWRINGQCLHVSITYHHHWPGDKAALQREKQAIQMFISRLGVCGIWKLEFQGRYTPKERAEREKAGLPCPKGEGSLKVPHWHLLVWLRQTDLEDFCASVSAWWQIRTDNPSKHAIDFRIGDAGKASFYLQLHSAKANQTPPFAVGRWWGFIDKKHVIASCDVQLERVASARSLVWAYRLYRRLRRIRATPLGAAGRGFAWYLDQFNQERMWSWIDDKILEESERAYNESEYLEDYEIESNERLNQLQYDTQLTDVPF